MTAAIIRADARRLPLPDESVDLVCTSPPYWGLRAYTDGGERYDGQIGAESTPREYVAALIECTREWMRVLKPTGSLWVNLGDAYYSGKGAPGKGNVDAKSPARRIGVRPLDRSGLNIPRKSLVGTPWRYALAVVDDLGLTLRAEVIWSKPNPLPESIDDRVRRSHEQFFHFTKQPRYFAAVDEIRDPPSGYPRPQSTKMRGPRGGQKARTMLDSCNPLGALPGSVWEVASQPLQVPPELAIDHYAAFPPALIRRIILGWSPSGICSECGEGRRPVVDRPGLLGGDNNPESRNGSRTRSTMDGGSAEWQTRIAKPDRITGYACACPEPTVPTRPALVVDPFGGTGTTALVASIYGRRAISFDLSHDYGRLAQWRTTDPAERARALGVPKPPPEPGQDRLFEVTA